ncbi:cytochrome c oxidase subunit 2A [Paraburkholderia sp. NMBU_R16]|uniref:cytochrome c oxidase subunit 2A n=1 Tax=Paraburkholderia sp. NMBU_R16 TaxID=2698676 RepID=UPI0015653176|nr:cytochrome c oxidase subunit 2A [Paraburkholderia sp. NMBU_R16]NRO99092.1 cytochrome c oxidase subunit 2A [Paraburkholderia sp. NMBU_R16]
MNTSNEARVPVERGDDRQVEEIVRSGPSGALAVAGIATAIVIALWFAFYFLVFLPRGVIY